jgi:hypothetical protein
MYFLICSKKKGMHLPLNASASLFLKRPPVVSLPGRTGGLFI